MILPWIGTNGFLLIGNYLISDDLQENRADLGVLLGGEFPNRALEAANLWHEKRIKRIFVTANRESDGYYLLKENDVPIYSKQERNARLLERMGVPKDALIILSGSSNSTESEATQVKRWFAKNPPRGASSIVIVTSPTHTKRSKRIFRRHLPSDVHIFAKPTRFDTFSEKKWWRERHLIKEVILEYQKTFFDLLTASHSI